MPRNAEGGKVEGPTHREEEQESRNGKTEKGLPNILFNGKLNKNIAKITAEVKSG